MSALPRPADPLPGPLTRWPEAANAAACMLSMADLQAWLAYQDFPGTTARAENGETPLMRAARRGEDRVVEALLAHGADACALDDDGNGTLWFASLCGAPATMRRLVQAGAPVDHANDDGITCLMQAAASGWVEVVDLLLALGATTRISAPDGRSAFDMAADRGRELLRLARGLSSAYPQCTSQESTRP